MHRAPRAASPLIGLALIASVVGGLAMAAPDVAITFAPTAVLIASLLFGAAPGEELIARLRSQRLPSRPRRPGALAPRMRPTVVVARAGHRLAAAPAMRPPPRACA